MRPILPPTLGLGGRERSAGGCDRRVWRTADRCRGTAGARSEAVYVEGMRLRLLLARPRSRRSRSARRAAPLPRPSRLVKVADGLSSPVYATSAPGDKRLFVVEQGGTIRTVRNGKVAARPYADLRALRRLRR